MSWFQNDYDQFQMTMTDFKCRWPISKWLWPNSNSDDRFQNDYDRLQIPMTNFKMTMTDFKCRWPISKWLWPNLNADDRFQNDYDRCLLPKWLIPNPLWPISNQNDSCNMTPNIAMTLDNFWKMIKFYFWWWWNFYDDDFVKWCGGDNLLEWCCWCYSKPPTALGLITKNV